MCKFSSRWLYIISLCFSFHGDLLAKDHSTIEFRTIGIPPYGIQSGASQSGVYYEAANSIASLAGYKINNKIYPYARIIHEIKTGLTDMTIMFKYEQLEDHVFYIAPLEPLKIVVLGLKGTSFDSVQSLKGKSIAYLRAAKFSDVIDNDPEIIRVDTTSFTQGVRMLMLKRVDAIIGPMDPLIFKASELTGNKKLFGEPLLVGERTPWVQVSKNSMDKISIDKIESIFKSMVEQGELNALLKKYMNIKHTTKMQAY